MPDIVIVRDISELEEARRFFGDSLNKTKVYTLFPPQYLDLVLEGVQPNIFSQKITATEANDIYRCAFTDMTRITNTFLKTENKTSTNMARYFKVFYWQYLTEVYVLDITIRRILDEDKNVKIYYIQRYYPVPTSHNDLHNTGMILEQIMTALKRLQPSVVQPIAGSDTHRESRHRSLLVSLRNFAGNWLRRVKTLKLHMARALPVEARVIAFGSGYDALVVLPDALRIAGETRRKPLWMTEKIDKDTIRSGLVYKDEYEQVERFSISQYISAYPVPRLTGSEIRQADSIFRHMMESLNQLEVVNRYNLTDGLSGLRNEFRYAQWRRKVLNRVLAHFAGSAIIVSNYNGLDERIIEQAAKHQNIEVYARPHGWMSNYEGFEYLADRYFCDGQLRAELVEKLLGYKERVQLSPDPSLLNVSNEWLNKAPDEKRSIIASKRTALSIKAPYIILLMTTAAKFRCALNEFDYGVLLESWSAIFEYLKSNPDIFIIVKSHKFNFDKWVSKIAKERGVKNLAILSGRLEDAIIIADLVVDFGKPGTATLSALFFEQPLLLYRGLYKYVREMGDLTYAVGKSFTVDKPDLLVREFKNIHSKQYLADLKIRNRTLLDALVTL